MTPVLARPLPVHIYEIAVLRERLMAVTNVAFQAPRGYRLPKIAGLPSPFVSCRLASSSCCCANACSRLQPVKLEYSAGSKTSGPARAVRPAAASATHAEATSLLDWLVERHNAQPSCLKVERQFGGEDVGYCLVAIADIGPGEVILSVPLTAAISSSEESRWSTHMAAQLLQRQQEAAPSQAAAAAGAGAAAGAASAAVPASTRLTTAAGSCQPWLDALPAHVDLPWLYWSDAELAELQDEDTAAEAAVLRRSFEAACQELGPRFSRGQVAWALSQVFSRSFVMEGAHIWVPGIDLCNHSLAPSADIRCVHSPGSCQGAAALDDVCPPDTAAAQQAEPSRLELLAGERGIAAGEEVTISYGGWPSDVFLLFFGFAPLHNPHDEAVLFYDLFDLATFKQRLVDCGAAGAGQQAQRAEFGVAEEEEAWGQGLAAVQQLEQQLGPKEAFHRMVATAAGIDSRLLDATQALLMAGRGSPSGQPMSLPQFLQQRCQQLLAAYPTTLRDDEQLLAKLEAAGSGGVGNGRHLTLPPDVRLQQLATAVRYRMGKQRVLHATLAGLQP